MVTSRDCGEQGCAVMRTGGRTSRSFPSPPSRGQAPLCLSGVIVRESGRSSNPCRNLSRDTRDYWITRLRVMTSEFWARSAARIIRGPGQAAFHPPLWRGQVLPLDNSRGMERLEAHQSCVIRAAFWTARAPLGAPLAAFSFDAGSALCVSPLRLAVGTERDPLRAAAASVSRANLGGSASASSWQGVVSAPGQSPASPEGRLTRPARGRRISGTGLSRRLRHQDRL